MLLPLRTLRALPTPRFAAGVRTASLERSFTTSRRLLQEAPRSDQAEQPREEIKWDLPKYVNEPGGPAHIPKIRTKVKRDLPPVKSEKLKFLVMFVGMCCVWSVYIVFAHNRERTTSTGFRYAARCVREHPDAQHALGGPARLEPGITGDPWVGGTINVLQGKIDVTFRVVGPLRGGTVYFTSIRRHKGDQFEVIRFALVPDRKGKAGDVEDETQVISLLGSGRNVMED